MALSEREIVELYKSARHDRRNFDEHWQAVSDLVLPTRDFIVGILQGTHLREAIFNETAPLAAESLAAALHGLLTNPAIRWMGLSTGDDDLNRDLDVQAWLYDTSTRLLAWFASTRSGFATNIHESFLDSISFGTDVMLTIERPDALIFQARQLANFWVLEDDSGRATHNFRRFDMKLGEMIGRFGESVSPKLLKLGDNPKNLQKRFAVLHAIYDRRAAEPKRNFVGPKRWASVYLEFESQHKLRDSGFDMNPYLFSRWSKAPQECYGRGPAMQVLPAIRTVNAMSRTQIIAGELAVHPPLNVPAAMRGAIRTAPGSINYVPRDMKSKPEAMFTGVNITIGEKLIVERELKIEKAFFLDKLKLPDNDRMTATEIIARRQEGLLQASPILSRQYSEKLNPAVARVFEWMSRTGRLLPTPPVLVGKQLKIDYVSPMALSQRSSEASAITAAIQTLTPFIQSDPNLFENIDLDDMFRAVWGMHNANPRFLRNPADVARMRQQREQAEQLAQRLQQAEVGAAAAADVAGAIKDIGAAGSPGRAQG